MSLLITKGLGRTAGSAMIEDVAIEVVEMPDVLNVIEIDEEEYEVIELGKLKKEDQP